MLVNEQQLSYVIKFFVLYLKYSQTVSNLNYSLSVLQRKNCRFNNKGIKLRRCSV